MHKSHVLLYFLLIVAIVIIYFPMLNNFFHSDDYEHIGFVLNGFPNIFKTLSSPDRLITPFLHIINFFIILFFGINPLPFQITNLSIHILNTVLVGILITLLTDKKILGIIGVFYWGLNDKYTEVVLELFQVGRLILFFWLLISFIFLIMYFKKKEIKYYFLSLITYILSFFSYWDFVIVCPVILVYVFIFHGFNRKNIIKISPFLFIFIIYIISQIFLKNTFRANSYYNLSWNWLKSFSVNMIDFFELYHYGCGSTILGIIFILLIIVAFIFLNDKVIRFGLIFMVFSFVPTVFVHFQPTRYLYIPLFGLTLILTKVLWEFIEYCNRKKFKLLKYSITASIGIILIVSHTYGIIIDENYRDYRGRIDKDVYQSFKNVFSELPKNTPIAFVDLESESFKAIGSVYYAVYPERLYFKRIVSRYWRTKGVMGLIYLKDLVLLSSFESGRIFKWQSTEVKSNILLIFSNNKFIIKREVSDKFQIKETGIITEKI